MTKRHIEELRGELGDLPVRVASSYSHAVVKITTFVLLAPDVAIPIIGRPDVRPSTFAPRPRPSLRIRPDRERPVPANWDRAATLFGAVFWAIR